MIQCVSLIFSYLAPSEITVFLWEFSVVWPPKMKVKDD